MIGRILKKDMKRRKSVNAILFLFITIAAVFLASSVNNILVVASAENYYLDYANIPEVSVITSGTEEKEEIDHWLGDEAEDVDSYGYDTIIALPEKGITIKKTGKDSDFDGNGATIYLGAKDTEYCKVFDKDGKEFSLQPGELAMNQATMDRNHIKPGDRLSIRSGNTKKEFTVKLAVKDAAFGNEMTGMKRLVVSRADYSLFAEDSKSDLIGMYYVNTRDSAKFSRALNNQGFASMGTSITRDTYKMTYSFDMIVAALLILIGICLILIALLVLRFTLVFTIEEDYREIGIMKAVGLKNFAIKKIYLAKYLALVTAGSLLGLAISVPVSKTMIAGVSENMIMEDSSANLWANLICTLAIILVVMLFSYGCMRKLNKVSAITAIHGGQTGRRYGRRKGISLCRRSRMPVAAFLGMNDIFSHPKRYLVLMITFCISFILITLPLNTVNTMQSREMAQQFCLDPDSSVYVRKIEKNGSETYKSGKAFERDMDRVSRELKEKGYNAELTGIVLYFFTYNQPGEKDKNNIMTIQILGPNNQYQEYKKGTAPVLENEIAFSEQILEEKGWKIGDSVVSTIGGEKKTFIITGTYSDYMQLGKSARMNPKLDCSKAPMFDYWEVLVDIDTKTSQEVLLKDLAKDFPDYEWSNAQEVVDRNVGGIQQTIQGMLIPMTGLLCAVIMLITFLMERLFIVREKGEIAMMKSMGYKNRTIRLWQVLRMVFVALVSMAAAIPLSLLSNQYMIKPIFALMGADVEVQVVPRQVYGIYPGILLAGIIAATILAAFSIKKINIRELNNLE
ncbi:ABC transporter permease [Anaerovorax odorimutans]|uniref:ABC transporter permease n=1 Tax=Anaerovorax odorimutans TaxID=109327 RepID=A0ABT1RSF8_9FIRM|nr:ABC transporter permease [Anaerovorax odorimutans]MCQ4638150.1 ABC transporter permease [Anaerovorax odorimutans]